MAHKQVDADYVGLGGAAHGIVSARLMDYCALRSASRATGIGFGQSLEICLAFTGVFVAVFPILCCEAASCGNSGTHSCFAERFESENNPAEKATQTDS